MTDRSTGYDDSADRPDICAECGDELTPDEARICRHCCDQQDRLDDGPTEDDLYPSADDAHDWEDGNDDDDWPERPRGV